MNSWLLAGHIAVVFSSVCILVATLNIREINETTTIRKSVDCGHAKYAIHSRDPQDVQNGSGGDQA